MSVLRSVERHTSSRSEIPRIFVGLPYQCEHKIGSFLGGLFRKILPYLNKGAYCQKRSLIKGINDRRKYMSLKEAVKNRLTESRDNLKRKVKEKISSLMRAFGYKISAKSSAL